MRPRSSATARRFGCGSRVRFRHAASFCSLAREGRAWAQWLAADNASCDGRERRGPPRPVIGFHRLGTGRCFTPLARSPMAWRTACSHRSLVLAPARCNPAGFSSSALRARFCEALVCNAWASPFRDRLQETSELHAQSHRSRAGSNRVPTALHAERWTECKGAAEVWDTFLRKR